MYELRTKLVDLSRTALPNITEAPVVSFDDACEKTYHNECLDPSTKACLRDVPLLASLVERYPNAGYPWWLLAEVAKGEGMHAESLRFYELRANAYARALGSRHFCKGGMDDDENIGFCQFFEALHEQAEATLKYGDVNVAKLIFEQMLFLAPSDGFGAREYLPAIYLHQKDEDALVSLKTTFMGWFFPEVDLAFLALAIADNRPLQAMYALDSVIRMNKFVIYGLIGSKDLSPKVNTIDEVVSYMNSDLSHADEVLGHFDIAADALTQTISTVAEMFPKQHLDNPVWTYPREGFKFDADPVEDHWNVLSFVIDSALSPQVATDNSEV
jgi:hypothetical protein